jgi:hypothetical protein
LRRTQAARTVTFVAEPGRGLCVEEDGASGGALMRSKTMKKMKFFVDTHD